LEPFNSFKVILLNHYHNILISGLALLLTPNDFLLDSFFLLYRKLIQPIIKNDLLIQMEKYPQILKIFNDVENK
jgi:hypothetical protein